MSVGVDASEGDDAGELRAFLEHVRDIVVTLDPEYRVVRASRSAERFFGAPGGSFLEAVHLDDLGVAQSALESALDPRARCEWRLVDADGDEVPFGWSLCQGAKGGRRFAIGRDLSERLESERRLRNAQRMEAIARLTGGIAHDFNNILAVIVGNVELLLEHFADDPQSVSEAALISQAADRGVQLVARLVAYSQRQDLASAVSSVPELFARLKPRLAEVLGKAIALEVEVAPDAWRVDVDGEQLESVVLDVASNAVGAMPEGGRFTVRASNVTLGFERRDFERLGVIGGAGERVPGDYVLLAFTDDGIGMSPEVLASAFEPFFTTKGVGRGSGLGLAMLLGFVRQSGGMVGVRTRQRGVERGTTINLLFPRAGSDLMGASPAAPSPAPEPRPAVAPVASRSDREPAPARILVVDDEELVRAQVDAMLRRMGYEVRSVETAREAMALLEEGERFDLLFTDVLMPGDMSGPELVAAARGIVPALRVLYTSGYTAELLSQRSGREVEADRLLTKPYRKQELKEKIEAALAARR
ncbi:MAG: response regulator [Deltaproteobacteria bacterium]|nr:response regulator [Deltaproteobacteria bacterium]